MPSHVDPAIYVAANIGDRAVVARAMVALRLSQSRAVGHLVMFWGAAAMNTSDGRIGHLADVQIERWAGWDGKRGAFAAWLRKEHLDEFGRPSEWEEYAGRLVVSREKAREKKRGQRGQAPVCPGDSPGDKRGTVSGTSRGPLTRAREEGEGKREGERDNLPPDTSREALLVIAANQAITRRWGEQTQPLLPGHGATHQLAQALLTAGVPAEFAQRSIARQVEAKADGPPRSMAYFRLGILADWEGHQVRALGAGAPDVIPLEPAPKPRRAHGDTGFLASVIAEEEAKRKAQEVPA